MRAVARAAALTLLLAVPPWRATRSVAGSPVADLSVASGVDPGTVVVGNDATAVVTVRNHGPDAAQGVRVTFEIGDGLAAASPHSSRGSCQGGGSGECDLGTLRAGRAATVRVIVSPVAPGVHELRALATTTTTDPEPGDDSALAVVEGRGRRCDVVGTHRRDELRVRRRGSVACALGGADVLRGAAGRQVLLGGSGSDLASGAAGDDVLRGGDGRDSLRGDRGDDRVLGGRATDGCIQGVGSGRKRGCEALGFGLAGGLALYEPARRVIGYGFHESLFDVALAMRPLGRLARSAHGGFSAPPPTDGPRYVVMDTRNRGTAPTTAVDVVVPSRTRVRSPVTGTVVQVRRYRLYCEDLDWKVVIRPREARDLRVLVLHLARVRVDEGDEVAASSSVLGVSSRNDEPSAQQNRYFPDRYPHVHIEVERDGASPTPGCAV